MITLFVKELGIEDPTSLMSMDGDASVTVIVVADS